MFRFSYNKYNDNRNAWKNNGTCFRFFRWHRKFSAEMLYKMYMLNVLFIAMVVYIYVFMNIGMNWSQHIEKLSEKLVETMCISGKDGECIAEKRRITILRNQDANSSIKRRFKSSRKRLLPILSTKWWNLPIILSNYIDNILG